MMLHGKKLLLLVLRRLVFRIFYDDEVTLLLVVAARIYLKRAASHFYLLFGLVMIFSFVNISVGGRGSITNNPIAN